MNSRRNHLATALLAGVLTLSALGGIVFVGGAQAALNTRFGHSTTSLHLAAPLDRSFARQGLFRSPLEWRPQSSSTQWALASGANPQSPNGVIQGVSCQSSSSCEAVGSSQSDLDEPLLLAEVWNGETWTTQSVPRPSGSISSELLAVSCTAASACVAVGDYGLPNGNLLSFAETWNGVNWTLRHTANPAGNQGATLTAVSCISAGCEAVGYYYDADFNQLALAEVWNGSNWKIQKTPDPTTTNGAQLTGVSCTTLGCEAVGFYGTDGGKYNAAFAEAWNGLAWSSQTVPEPSDSNAHATNLESVSCVSSAKCEAVGGYDNKSGFLVALTEVWNGISWAAQPAPNPSASNGLELNVVSCVSSNVCAAVGFENYGRSGDSAGVVEVWDGVNWVLQSNPDPGGSAFVALATVSCPVSGFCESAGFDVNSAGEQTVLAEGTTASGWVAQRAPNADGNSGAQLAGVSCAKRTACEAVGQYNVFGAGNAWAEGLTGGSWKLQLAPNPRGGSNSELNAVSCRSASRCEAVGDYLNGVAKSLTLGELWNGHRWTVQRTPNPHGSLASTLDGVSCSSSTNCEAVGQRGLTHYFVLAEHWNGHSWDLQKTPKARGIDNELQAVSCASKTRCEAVGQYTRNSKSGLLLAEGWNGHKWAVQTISAPRGTQKAVLNGVSCTSANACEAVGSYEHGHGVRPLAEAWNGHKWSLQRAVRPGSSNDFSEFDSVSCTSKNACEATGDHLSFSSFDQFVVAEVWNGHSWRKQNALTPDGFASGASVSCSSKNLCRVVGVFDPPEPSLEEPYGLGSATVPLIETFRG
jgi:hypothetical protein